MRYRKIPERGASSADRATPSVEMGLDAGRDRDLSATPLRKLGHDSQERRSGGSWRELVLDGSKLRHHLIVHGDLNACSRVSLDPPHQGRQLFPRFADREFHRILQVNWLKMYNHVQRMSMHRRPRHSHVCLGQSAESGEQVQLRRAVCAVGGSGIRKTR